MAALPLTCLNMNGSVNIHVQTNACMTMALSSTTTIFNFYLQIGASNLIQFWSKICKQTLSANACISLLPILFLFSCILTLHRWYSKLNSLSMMLSLLHRMLTILPSHDALGVSPGALVCHRDMLLDAPHVADSITLRNK